MSASAEKKIDWVYRIFERRTVSIKGKNEQNQKLAATDLTTNLPFVIEVSKDISMENIEVEKTYFLTLKIYTARNAEGVAPEFVEFFNVLDVDQAAEDFIKAYWIYPKHIKFELVELEPAE